MKNAYEVRGDITAIFLRRKDDSTIETRMAKKRTSKRFGASVYAIGAPFVCVRHAPRIDRLCTIERIKRGGTIMATLERVHYEASRASSRIKKALWTQAREAAMAGRPLTIVGVGSESIVGDALGPYVASKVADYARSRGAYVTGTLKTPVHACNLAVTVDLIDAMEAKPFVIAVDAAVSTRFEVGLIGAYSDPLRPGAGIGKTLPSIGDVSIVGTTFTHWTTPDIPEAFKVSFATIIGMGDVIASALKSLVTDYAKVQRGARA